MYILFGTGGSISLLDEQRAQSALPPTQSQMLIYAYYYQYWIENTLKFLKLFDCLNVVCDGNRTHMAGKNLRKKSKQEVGNLRFVVFELTLSNTQWDMGYFALPLDVNRLQNVVSGFSCEGGPDESCLNKGSAYSLVLNHALSIERQLSFHCFSTDNGILQLEPY